MEKDKDRVEFLEQKIIETARKLELLHPTLARELFAIVQREV